MFEVILLKSGKWGFVFSPTSFLEMAWEDPTSPRITEGGRLSGRARTSSQISTLPGPSPCTELSTHRISLEFCQAPLQGWEANQVCCIGNMLLLFSR